MPACGWCNAMGKMTIRQATPEDIPRLAELKCAYVRNLYRGFLSRDILNHATPGHYTVELTQWLETGRFRIALTQRDGIIRDYIVYGDNSQEPYNGLIHEGVCSDMTTSEDKRLLVEHCLQDLRQRGHTVAYLWLLVDNFRTRFLFESLGFKADGARQTRTLQDQELRIARYIYPLV